MNDIDRRGVEARVLVLAPSVDDQQLALAILARAGIACVGCRDPVHACEQLAAGAGALLIAEEVADGCGGVADWLALQSSWSDMPVLLLARVGAGSAAVAWAMENFRNVTVLERPALEASLVSAVRTALRARQGQYQLRDQLVERARSAEQLNLAMAAANAGSWQVNLATGEFSASERAIALLGLPPGTQMNHERALAFIHPVDRAGVQQALQSTFETGTPFRHEHRVSQPDGSVRWVSSYAERRGESGQTCVIGLVQDVTERKVADEQLRASEERFRATFDQAAVGIAHVGLDGRWLRVNRKLCATVGYSPDELMARTFQDITHPDDLNADLDSVGRLLADEIETYSMQKRYIHRDGRRIWINLTVSLVRTPEGQPAYFISVVEDITDRRRADEQIRYSEQLHRLAFDQSPTGKFYGGLDGRLIKVNAAMCEITGHAAGDLVGMPMSDFTHPDDRAHDAELVTPFLRGDRPTYGNDKRVVRRDGGVRWVSISERMVTDAEGRPVHSVGVALDITERKTSEAELRASEQRVRLATEATQVGIWEWNVLSNAIRWDAQMFRIYGITPTADGTVEYTDWSGTVLPADLAENEAILQDVVRRCGSSTRNFRIRRRNDGECRHVTSVETVRMNDRGVAEWVVGTNLDITERQRAEEALRESEARLGGILRRSPAGIVQTDAAGRMTLVNPGWCEMLGYAEPQMLGRNILEITHPSSVEATAAAFGTLAAGGPDFQIEKAYSRKDGSVLRAQSNVAAIRSPAGEFLGLIAVVLDISERLRSEEELRRLAAELSEADHRKDVFLATLAHELRNPLAPIRNGLQLMKQAGNNGEVMNRARAMMDRQLTQLIRLVDDLLDVSRITQGKVELRKERADLRAVIDAAVETSRPAIEKSGHAMTVVVPEAPVWVDGDPTRLAQVVSNLLYNSAKYTPRGGRVHVSVGCDGQTAVVSVKDSGIGIPPAMLDTVFVMFTQVDRTLEKTTGGLGIGLSLAKGLLEMHGGTIEARSEGEGMGSEFIVRLPLATVLVGGSEDPDEQTRESVPSAPCRIVVVDDNVDSADSLGQVLEMLGHAVRTANDGEAGIAVAAEFRPDVVLMDIGMPRLNGYEAARRIRQQPWGQGMVLVALTGWGQEDDRKKSAAAGFDHHLVKPVEIDALMKLLSRLTGVDGLDANATLSGVSSANSS